MIDRLVVSGFKRIDQLELPLGAPATVLLGGNNCGKSSVLEAVHLAVSAAQAVRLGGAAEWRDDKLEAVVPQERLASARVDLASSLRHGREVATVTFYSEAQRCAIALTPRSDNIAVSMAGQLLGEQVMEAETPFCVYVPGLAGIPLREPAMVEGAVRRAIARGDSNLVLRNVLYLLNRQAAAWPGFEEDLRAVFPESAFEFLYAPGTDESIRVRFRHGSAELVPLENAGNGVLQCIQLLAYAHLFKPRVLLLDEPDAHLHATNQRRLCRLLLKIAGEQPDKQILLATHSRHIVSALHRASRMCWLKDGELLSADGTDLVAGLVELGALDDGEKLAGRTLRCVVLTEDEDQSVLEPLLWSSDFVEEETLVLSYQGCTNHIAVAALCRTFSDRLPGARIVVHRDRDYADAKEVERIEGEIKAAHALPFVTEGTDAEAYYLNADYLRELGVEPQDGVALVEEAERRAKPEALRKLINYRVALATERRKKGGSAPDHGLIAQESQRDLDAEAPKLRHGKLTLARLRGPLQERGINPNPFFRTSAAIRVSPLARIAREIWPAPPHVPPASDGH